jgi:serine/threonine protein kinase
VTQTSDDALVGQVVEDRYRIEGTLGQGGMGVVYLARHIKVGREVAIKVLRGDLMTDATMVERFEREATIAARLSHRNLISVIDVGETASKQRLMVLELARGETLATIVGRGPLARDRVVALTSQLLAGLEHAHDAGLVHRDLKPENVIVEVDAHGIEIPRIVDFGVALLRGEAKRLTTAGLVLGTPAYMAPEHAQGHAVDPRCDLFALGVMLYEMLGGKLPFDGNGVEVALANVTRDPPSIAARTGVAVDPVLEAFVRRLMARRVRDRFQSARAAHDVLGLVDRHRAAAEEILRPSHETPPRPRITALGTLPRTFAARAITRRETELALASTLEAPAPRRRRRKRVPPPTTPWQPWKSFGLIGGALAAAITVATIGLVDALTCTPVDLPMVMVSSSAISPELSSFTVAREPVP